MFISTPVFPCFKPDDPTPRSGRRAHVHADTLLLFCKGELHIVTGGKKATLLGAIAAQCEKEAGVKLAIHNKPKVGRRRCKLTVYV